jgi:hypothetical protein
LGRLAPWTALLREQVLKGPAPYDKVLSEMTATIPPGRAYRDYLRKFEWDRERRGTDLAKPMETSKTDGIIRGKVQLAYTAIWSQVRAGRVDVFYDGETRMVRVGRKGWDLVAAPVNAAGPVPIAGQVTEVGMEVWNQLRNGPIPYETAVERVGAKVTADHALRTGTRVKVTERRNSGRSTDISDLSAEYLIAKGRRSEAVDYLYSYQKSHRIVRYKKGDVDMVGPGPAFWPEKPTLR